MLLFFKTKKKTMDMFVSMPQSRDLESRNTGVVHCAVKQLSCQLGTAVQVFVARLKMFASKNLWRSLN